MYAEEQEKNSPQGLPDLNLEPLHLVRVEQVAPANGHITGCVCGELYLEQPFPITVRGMGTNGRDFEEHTVIHGFSTQGLCMRLANRVAPDARLFFVVRLSLAPRVEANAPLVAIRGIVRANELQADGTWGISASFTRHRFLYPR